MLAAQNPLRLRTTDLARNYHITWCQKCLFWRLKMACDVMTSDVFLGIFWPQQHRSTWSWMCSADLKVQCAPWVAPYGDARGFTVRGEGRGSDVRLPSLVAMWSSKEKHTSKPKEEVISWMFLRTCSWAAANAGVTNGGLRGVWPPFLEIGRNPPFLPFFCLFALFWREEKGFFPQISLDFLKPPSLKPPFAALQSRGHSKGRRGSKTSVRFSRSPGTSMSCTLM